MAKLNARGREEWLRLEIVEPTRDGRSVKTQVVFMSDMHRLQRKVFLKADGKIDFDDGWKDLGKTKFEIQYIKDAWTARGWKVVGK